MLLSQVKRILIICLCLSLFWFTLGCTGDMADGISLEPVKELRITIDESQREQLFQQFQKFAEKHNFEIHITDYGNRGEHFQVWMSGENIQIISGDVPANPKAFHIHFYGKYPGSPVDEELVNELLDDLKKFLGEIPNATIVEERY